MHALLIGAAHNVQRTNSTLYASRNSEHAAFQATHLRESVSRIRQIHYRGAGYMCNHNAMEVFPPSTVVKKPPREPEEFTMHEIGNAYSKRLRIPPSQ